MLLEGHLEGHLKIEIISFIADWRDKTEYLHDTLE